MTRLQKKKWLESMMERFNTSEEGVREIMRERQRKSIEARRLKGAPHRGGFSNKDLAKQAGRKGLDSRWGK